MKRIGTGEESPQTAMQMQVQGNIEMIRELATNPAVDVDKLERILNLQERSMAKAAEMAFSDAMTEAQVKMKKVVAKSKSERGKYAKYDALDVMLRPIYTEHGFSLKFDTGQGKDPTPVPADHVRVWLFVSHRDGHKDDVHTDMPLPTEGARGGSVMNKTQATGAAMSYGMRYLLKFFFNVAVGEDDNNGMGGDGGRDHRYQKNLESVSAPVGKSESRARPSTTAAREPLKPAASAGDKISQSNVKSLEAVMRRAKPPITAEDFMAQFGIPLNQVDKHDLNTAVTWLQQEGDRRK